MKKVLLIIGIIIIVLGITSLVLANIKSPETSKNLLNYWRFHSKSWECNIEKQVYTEVKQYSFDEKCVERLCDENFPKDPDYTGRINWNSQGCIYGAESGKLNHAFLQECVKNSEIIKKSVYPEIEGQLVKYYYFGIPVLKESCPKGYLPK